MLKPKHLSPKPKVRRQHMLRHSAHPPVLLPSFPGLDLLSQTSIRGSKESKHQAPSASQAPTLKHFFH